MKVTPSFSVNVDPTNPGQFFACCGLLELADRLWQGAEGWFDKGGREFHVSCGTHTITETLHSLATCSVTAIEKIACNALEVPEKFRPLRVCMHSEQNVEFEIDAWTRIVVEKGVVKVVPNPPWNFWSGQQTSEGIWKALQTELAKQIQSLPEQRLPDLFYLCLFQKGRFGFDPGPAWNALDVGFSPNEHSLLVKSSAAVELLAAFGLQRFRPIMHYERESFRYFTWNSPLSPSVAAAAAAGGICNADSQQFHATVVQRGQYAALGRAFLISSGDLR